ncbi:bone morphogenetic protein 4-like [Amphiura filiformis]|uniref:bone morphogenetic protein 4-like n=1 Tax=Amphiura filiformis TaxID=82378 RepID=UPI003B21C272
MTHHSRIRMCVQGVPYLSSYMHQSRLRLVNFYKVFAIFFLLYLCLCQQASAGCPNCGVKYPDSRLRTGSDSGGKGGGSAESVGVSSKLDPVEVKAFKRSFLSKLGLRRPPSRREVARANVSIEVLENMKRVYALSILENNRTHELYPELDTKQFYSFTGTGVEPAIPTTANNYTAMSESVQIIFGNFSLPKKRRDHIRVHSAKLQLYFKDTNLSNEISEDRGRAEIYHTVAEKNRRTGSINQIRQLLDVRPVSYSNAGWVTFDIKEAVQRWENDRNAASNSGLEIQLSRPELRDSLVLENELDDLHKNTEHFKHHRFVEETKNQNNHPRLDITVKESPRRRSRRSLRTHHPARAGTDCRRGESTCCRYSRTVSFADLDWDYWVHSPHEYNAYYCDGSCPQGHRMASTYAVIKSQMHIVNPSQWNAPCCTASKLGPLPVLHYDSSSPDLFTVTVMDDWVVEECMCM